MILDMNKLPERIQTLWRRVFDSALQTYEGNKERAEEVACAVVKRQFQKGQFRKLPNGEWISRKEATMIWNRELAEAAWTVAYINDLPDSAFAYIEPGGKKDEQGKTIPRSLRHFPIKDANGSYDAAHVRNALARAPQSPFGEKAMSKIRVAARALKIGENAKESETPKRGLQEAAQPLSRDLRLDRENGIIYGASIVGEKSAHGYKLTPRWHESAVRLLEGAKLGLNHPDWYVRRDKPLPTKLDELAGRVRNAHYEAARSRTVADLHLVRGPNRERVFDILESDPTLIGVSPLHDSVLLRDSPDELIRCEAIHRVDIVADPATTGGMFESTNPAEVDEMEWEKVTLDELKAKRPDLYEAAVADGESAKDAEAESEKLDEENKRLRTELATMKQAEAKRLKVEQVEKSLAEAKLTETAAKEIRPVLERCETAEEMKAVLTSITKAAEARSPKCQERVAEPNSGEIDKEPYQRAFEKR